MAKKKKNNTSEPTTSPEDLQKKLDQLAAKQQELTKIDEAIAKLEKDNPAVEILKNRRNQLSDEIKKLTSEVSAQKEVAAAQPNIEEYTANNNAPTPDPSDGNETTASPSNVVLASPPLFTENKRPIYVDKAGNTYVKNEDGSIEEWYLDVFDENGEVTEYRPVGSRMTANGDGTFNGGEFDEAVVSVKRLEPQLTPEPPRISPFDIRLQRSDLFLNGSTRTPYSTDEATSILADLNEFSPQGNGHAKPYSKVQYGITSNDPNSYGTLSLINPYSITRLYNSLKGMTFGKDNGINYVTFSENRMLDIRDQKRFYDTKISGDDVLSVTNPTTSNIIQFMNNDKWGRTPYTYQDFVFCKYWNRIPNNRLITLRKYAAPTYDNLCWELMGFDKDKLRTKFAPIATACTFFGGDSGNSLKELFKIQSGLNWEKLEADIWNVTGDSGESQEQVADRMLAQGTSPLATTNSSMINSMFNFSGKVSANLGSMLKFLGAAKSRHAFNAEEANIDKFYNNVHDPSDNGPYANRVKGPVNRISEVMKRKEGLKFEHKISLKFSYKARPIGGINTKAAMLDILSNMLLLCTASAVFWGGGHKFMINPHAYPWEAKGLDGFLKAVYNGKILGADGAIARGLKGVTDIGSTNGGGFDMNQVTSFLGKLGSGVLGAFGGALSALVGTLKGAGLSTISEYVAKGAEWLKGSAPNSSSYQSGISTVNNLLHNTQEVWRANSVKNTILPQVEGMRSILLGTPVGNWHLTVGNPLNPIAVIGNLICEDISFEFGEELGPDDFPDELECTVTLAHGMPRDLAAIESMFNRGAGRIYQAPDYIKMWGSEPSSEQETKVDAVTGGTASRVPHKFIAVDGQADAGKYYKLSEGKAMQNAGEVNNNIETPINPMEVVDYNRYQYSTGRRIQPRAAIAGNMHTRHYADS